MDSEKQSVEPDFFTSDAEGVESVPTATDDTQSVSWSASEFLLHQKSASWYLTAVAGVLACAAVTFILTKDTISTIAVVVLGGILLVVAGRKPRTIQYVVDSHGIVVGSHEYVYDDFQSFSVSREDGIECIVLYPHKRFSPEINMYFAPDDGQKIFDILSKFLPFEQREKDRIDKFLHKIRF